MARSRNIKPAFFKNEDLAEADAYTRLLFIGLWTLADKNGLLEYRPKRIKAELFPYEPEVDINGCITVLARLGFIHVLTDQKTDYIHILSFDKHQHPHHTEKTSLPDVKALTIKDSGEVTVKPPLSTRSNPSDSLIPITDSLKSVKQEPCSPPVITIPLNDNSEHPVTQEMVDEFTELYPAVDVMQALRSIRAWGLSNKTKRKTKSGVMKHINTWLAKEQDKGGGKTQNTLTDFEGVTV